MTQNDLSTKQKECFFLQMQRTDVVAKGESRGGRMDQEFGVGRYKLLYVWWIDNKILLYSRGNYIQSPGTNYNGKEYKKGCIYYITESLCYTSEIGTTLYFSFFKKAVYYFMGELQRHFHQERQGCPLSLLLFNIELEALKQFSQKHNIGRGLMSDMYVCKTKMIDSKCYYTKQKDFYDRINNPHIYKLLFQQT